MDFQAGKLVPGVYHAQGRIDVSGSELSGVVTFIAEEIKVSGSSVDLTPFRNGVLLFARGTGESVIHVSGSSGYLKGVIYAPLGEVKISGSKRRMDGSIFAAAIGVTGSNGWLAFAHELFPESSAIQEVTAAVPLDKTFADAGENQETGNVAVRSPYISGNASEKLRPDEEGG